MRERMKSVLPEDPGAPRVEVVFHQHPDPEADLRTYALISTQHRAVNKAIAVDAGQLDLVISLLCSARSFLHARGIETR